MRKPHLNADKQARSQRAQQSAERLRKQRERGSKKFDVKRGNVHNGASRGQSGQQQRH